MPGIKATLINDSELSVPDQKEIDHWFDVLAEHMNAEGEICIKAIDAEESRLLNHTYRDKDYATNVLSFPAEIPDYVNSDWLGDLAICSDVLIKEADENGKKLIHHWAHMCIHGALHLFGYDHIEANDAVIMEELEVNILKKLAIDNPYE